MQASIVSAPLKTGTITETFGISSTVKKNMTRPSPWKALSSDYW